MADTSDNESPAIVSNASNVDHAEIVSHADNVATVEVHGEPLRTERERHLKLWRDLARSAVVFFALLVMVVVIFDKNANENNLKQQLVEFRTARATADKLASDKLDCVRRYTDVTDTYRSKQLVHISDFLIIITQIPPGPDRVSAVNDKIAELKKTNEEAKNAIEAKVDYVNAGSPLPCPLKETPNPINGDGPPTPSTTTSVPPTG